MERAGQEPMPPLREALQAYFVQRRQIAGPLDVDAGKR
jgi:hypothetical protein